MRQPIPPHIYMGTALLTYLRDGVPKQRYLNVLVVSDTKEVTYNTLEQARMGSLQRLHDESEVLAADVKDYVIMNMFYCGQMTMETFQASQEVEETEKPVDLGKPNVIN